MDTEEVSRETRAFKAGTVAFYAPGPGAGKWEILLGLAEVCALARSIVTVVTSRLPEPGSKDSPVRFGSWDREPGSGVEGGEIRLLDVDAGDPTLVQGRLALAEKVVIVLAAGEDPERWLAEALRVVHQPHVVLLTGAAPSLKDFERILEKLERTLPVEVLPYTVPRKSSVSDPRGQRAFVELAMEVFFDGG